MSVGVSGLNLEVDLLLKSHFDMKYKVNGVGGFSALHHVLRSTFSSFISLFLQGPFNLCNKLSCMKAKN